MIRCDNISKYYPTRNGLYYVFRDASFEIPARAQVGVLGRNGSGKTTLMRMLAGVDVPNAGRIIKWGSVSWPLGIANSVQAQMTGRENTRFACRIQGLHSDQMPPIIDFVESFADIGDFFDEPARTYSSGMKARVGFGITMAFDFDFYIIDELSAVGDAMFKKRAQQIFEQKRRKSGFVRANHNFRELRAECQSGLVLFGGQIEYWPSIDEAIERYQFLNGLSGDGTKGALKAAGQPPADATGEPDAVLDGTGTAALPSRRSRRPKPDTTAPSQTAGVGGGKP